MPTIASSRVQPPPPSQPATRIPLAPRWLSELPAVPAPLRSESFGQWLVAQVDRGDVIDQLAARARRAPSFPRQGTAAQIRGWLVTEGSDRAGFAQLLAAERCWHSL